MPMPHSPKLISQLQQLIQSHPTLAAQAKADLTSSSFPLSFLQALTLPKIPKYALDAIRDGIVSGQINRSEYATIAEYMTRKWSNDNLVVLQIINYVVAEVDNKVAVQLLGVVKKMESGMKMCSVERILEVLVERKDFLLEDVVELCGDEESLSVLVELYLGRRVEKYNKVKKNDESLKENENTINDILITKENDNTLIAQNRNEKEKDVIKEKPEDLSKIDIKVNNKEYDELKDKISEENAIVSEDKNLVINKQNGTIECASEKNNSDVEQHTVEGENNEICFLGNGVKNSEKSKLYLNDNILFELNEGLYTEKERNDSIVKNKILKIIEEKKYFKILQFFFKFRAFKKEVNLLIKENLKKENELVGLALSDLDFFVEYETLLKRIFDTKLVNSGMCRIFPVLNKEDKSTAGYKYLSIKECSRCVFDSIIDFSVESDNRMLFEGCVAKILGVGDCLELCELCEEKSKKTPKNIDIKEETVSKNTAYGQISGMIGCNQLVSIINRHKDYISTSWDLFIHNTDILNLTRIFSLNFNTTHLLSIFTSLQHNIDEDTPRWALLLFQHNSSSFYTNTRLLELCFKCVACSSDCFRILLLEYFKGAEVLNSRFECLPFLYLGIENLDIILDVLRCYEIVYAWEFIFDLMWSVYDDENYKDNEVKSEDKIVDLNLVAIKDLKKNENVVKKESKSKNKNDSSPKMDVLDTDKLGDGKIDLEINSNYDDIKQNEAGIDDGYKAKCIFRDNKDISVEIRRTIVDIIENIIYEEYKLESKFVVKMIQLLSLNRCIKSLDILSDMDAFGVKEIYFNELMAYLNGEYKKGAINVLFNALCRYRDEYIEDASFTDNNNEGSTIYMQKNYPLNKIEKNGEIQEIKNKFPITKNEFIDVVINFLQEKCGYEPIFMERIVDFLGTEYTSSYFAHIKNIFKEGNNNELLRLSIKGLRKVLNTKVDYGKRDFYLEIIAGDCNYDIETAVSLFMLFCCTTFSFKQTKVYIRSVTEYLCGVPGIDKTLSLYNTLQTLLNTHYDEVMTSYAIINNSLAHECILHHFDMQKCTNDIYLKLISVLQPVQTIKISSCIDTFEKLTFFVDRIKLLESPGMIVDYFYIINGYLERQKENVQFLEHHYKIIEFCIGCENNIRAEYFSSNNVDKNKSSNEFFKYNKVDSVESKKYENKLNLDVNSQNKLEELRIYREANDKNKQNVCYEMNKNGIVFKKGELIDLESIRKNGQDIQSLYLKAYSLIANQESFGNKMVAYEVMFKNHTILGNLIIRERIKQDLKDYLIVTRRGGINKKLGAVYLLKLINKYKIMAVLKYIKKELLDLICCGDIELLCELRCCIDKVI